MRNQPLAWALLALVLVVAGSVRFTALDWDGGIGAHPDERYVVGVAEGLRWPDRMSPFDVDPAYAYGHLPVYLLWIGMGLAPAADPLLVGRVLAAALDLCTVGITFALGRRAFGPLAGVTASSLVGLMVLHVQSAHFYIADVPLAMFCAGALVFAVRLCKAGRWHDAVAAGVLAGLAAASKISGLLLVLPLGVACALGPGGPRERSKRLLASGVAALAAFVVAGPFAVVSLPTFARNVMHQAGISRGVVDVPYTRQYHATWPFLYPIVQQLRWGLGWLPGLAAFAGLAQAGMRAFGKRCGRAEWVLLAWTLPYLAFVGALYAKFPRYLLSLSPMLAVYGAVLVIGRGREADAGNGIGGVRDVVPRVRSARQWRRLALAIVLGAAALRCMAFVRMYSSPHPWVQATRWFAQHAPAGSTVAVEEWDHPLPIGMDEYDSSVLPVFDEETPGKWAEIAEAVGGADYVVIASRRGYATLARWPERYPDTGEYYRQLFTGGLGFEPVACFERHPFLGPFTLADDPTASLAFSLPAICGDAESESRPGAGGLLQRILRISRLDESLVVYDHPRAIVFRRSGSTPTAAETRTMLGEQ